MAVDVSGPALLRSVLLFGRELRAEGLTGDLATVIDFVRVLELIDIGEREQVHAAGAALFVRRRDQLEPYDLAFERFWRSRRGRAGTEAPPISEAPARRHPAEDRAAAAEASGEGRQLDLQAGAQGAAEGSEEPSDRPAVAPTAWSRQSVLRRRAFDELDADELHEVERAIDRLAPTVPVRRTRRWELDRSGPLLAPRQMFRSNLSAGGDLVEWVWRRRVRRPRGVVLLCDISGSMERYSRLLLRFGHALSRSAVPTEAFAFGTKLTRITPFLRARDPDIALRNVSDAVADWSGGTRIGDAFHEFNQLWARRVLRTSGIVVVVSDGWDRGDPDLVGTETARLGRNCHRLIWLNPLAGAHGYEPLAGGMAAAYPHIDRFLPAHDLASLEHLADVLAREAFLDVPAPLRPPAVASGAAAA
jgi:uncharacterized protein with von Willebrand factor type A (vWA) domain